MRKILFAGVLVLLLTAPAASWWPDNSCINVPVCSTSGGQHFPNLALDGNGGAIIAWQDYRSSGHYDIYAQRIGSNGVVRWTTYGEPICTESGDQDGPRLVSDGAGGAIITWQDERSGSDHDIYAQWVDSSGVAQWATNGVSICTTSGEQLYAELVSDGAGGAIITWQDQRSGVSDDDIYAQWIDSSGVAQWTSDGVAICTAPREQWHPELISDGAGGAIVTWWDYRSGSDDDIYVQRVDSGGDVQWITDGAPVCTVSGQQEAPKIISDGGGGAIIVWQDGRWGADDFDVYVQMIDGDGNALWIADGRPVSEPLQDQKVPRPLADGHGGAIITWQDERDDSNGDIYAQRVNRDGTLGPVPYILSIEDVPTDQGRQVSIMWERSFLDAPQYDMITEYSIWRKYPLGAKIEGSGREWDGRLPDKIVPGIYRRIERSSKGKEAKTDYWELLGTVEAHFWDGYAYIAPTLNDSSAGGVPYFTYVVSAHTEDPYIFWDSRADSGYSVDNINPAKTQLTALPLVEGKSPVSTIVLSWAEVIDGVNGQPEPDPVSYRIYCDVAPAFSPASGNILAETPELSYPHTDDRIGDPAVNLYYVVTAVDAGGNESAASNRVGEFDRHLAGVK